MTIARTAGCASPSMYICDICGARFVEPLILRGTEDLDGEGRRERSRRVLCPWCESPYYEEERDENK